MCKDFIDLYRVASNLEIWEQHPVKERAELYGFARFFSESIKSKGALLIMDQERKKVIGGTRFKPRPEFGMPWKLDGRFYPKNIGAACTTGPLKD